MDKIDTQRKLGPYGDEHCIDLSSRLASWNMKCVETIIANPMHVLSCSYWNNFSPWYVPPRKLPDNFCLFVLAGTVWLKLETAEYVLHPGEAFLLGVNVLHEFGLPKGEKQCRHIIFHALPQKPTPNNPIDRLSSPYHFIPSLEHEAEHLLDIIALAKFDNVAAQSFSNLFLNKTLLALAQQGKFESWFDARENTRLATATSYMETNYQGNIAIADVAAAAGIHEVQCRKLFRHYLKVSPTEYLSHIRLDHAVKLLLCSSLPIKEIAWKSGFSSDRYFCYVFKKHFSSTPQAYRLENANNIYSKLNMQLQITR